MRTPYEQPVDDTVCAYCHATLSSDPQPGTWAFNGFHHAGCAAECRHPFDLHGTALVIELARLGGGRGPGFEERVIRSWRARLAATPNGELWLAKRFGSDDPHMRHLSRESWSWRVYLLGAPGLGAAPSCLDFRLTPIPPCRHRHMVERPDDPAFAWQCADCGHVYGRSL